MSLGIPVLYVEDEHVTAKIVKRMVAKNFPELSLRIVSDANNAAKAVLGSPFMEWDLDINKHISCSRVLFHGALFDNQFPAREGEPASSDMGIATVKMLRSSEFSSDLLEHIAASHLLEHIAVTSNDLDPQKFHDCHYFNQILPKPVSLSSFRSLFTQWKFLPVDTLESADGETASLQKKRT